MSVRIELLSAVSHDGDGDVYSQGSFSLLRRLWRVAPQQSFTARAQHMLSVMRTMLAPLHTLVASQ